MTTVGSATSTKLQTVNHSRRSEFEGSRHRGYSETFFEQWPVRIIRLRSISVTRLSNFSRWTTECTAAEQNNTHGISFALIPFTMNEKSAGITQRTALRPSSKRKK